MKQNAFRHLPHLEGKIIGASCSQLRLTRQMLDTLDQRACELGLDVNWRLNEVSLEASRRDALGQPRKQKDLWVFAYGSLMWDVALHFTEVRRARLAGYERRFSYWTTIGRGTVGQPGLVLSLEPQPGHCEGLVFRIDNALVEQETRVLWQREMIVGGYQPRILKVETPQGDVDALLFAANQDHPAWAGKLTFEEIVKVISNARGDGGSNLDYFLKLVDQLNQLEVKDAYIAYLSALIDQDKITASNR